MSQDSEGHVIDPARCLRPGKAVVDLRSIPLFLFLFCIVLHLLQLSSRTSLFALSYSFIEFSVGITSMPTVALRP
jgi:hypothetical protein